MNFSSAFSPAPALVFVLVAGASISALLAACGGSSSESPWPIPPDSLVLGPAGEEGKIEAPDGGASRDAAPDVVNVNP